MKHCHGSPAAFVQADCGDVGPHDGHDYDPADRMCLGAPAGFEADCGQPGPHDEHPLREALRETIDGEAQS